MEICIDNDKIVYASEVKLDYNNEKMIRNASISNQLSCHECGQPVIFKRGEKRDAHFAHKSKTNCEYSLIYSKGLERSKSIIKIRDLLFDYFKNKYNDIRVFKDVKLFKGYWAPLYIELENNLNLVINIADKTMTSSRLESTNESLNDIGIRTEWIVLDKILNFRYEHNAYFVKRFQLYNSLFNSAIVIDKDTNDFALYIHEKEKEDKEHIFQYDFKLDSLYVDTKNGRLSAIGWIEAYEDWIKDQKEDYSTRYESRELLKFDETKQTVKDNNLIKEDSLWDQDKYHQEIKRIANGNLNNLFMIAHRFRVANFSNPKELDVIRKLYKYYQGESRVDHTGEYDALIEAFERVLERARITRL